MGVFRFQDIKRKGKRGAPVFWLYGSRKLLFEHGKYYDAIDGITKH